MERLRRALAGLAAATRTQLRSLWRTAGRDALVVGVVLLAGAVTVVVASLALVQVLAVAETPLGIALGWIAMFGLALAVPLVAMKLGGGLYERLGG